MRYTPEVTYLAVDGTLRTTAVLCCTDLITTPQPAPASDEVERLIADYTAIPPVTDEVLASKEVELEPLMQALHGILEELASITDPLSLAAQPRTTRLHIERLTLAKAIHSQRINYFPTNEQFSDAANLTPESGEHVARYCLACVQYLEGSHE